MLEIAELVIPILRWMAPVSRVSIEQIFYILTIAGDKKLMARKAFLCC